MRGLTGKAILISGGTSGIGLATAARRTSRTTTHRRAAMLLLTETMAVELGGTGSG
jgi:short-subunit dehydrogenase involved in D-alanine esterification of teichoic acids